MKKFLYTMLLIYSTILIVPNYVFAQHPVISQAPGSAVVKTERKEGKTDYFEYQLNIPQFSSLHKKDFETKLNRYYKTSIVSFQKKLKQEAKKYYEDANQTSTSLHPYIANVDYKVTYNNKPLLSLYVNYYRYTGGAHGMYEWRANTFDTDLGRELSLSDLFQATSSYEKRIQQELKRQIEQNISTFFPDAAEHIKNVSSLKFFLEPEHLIIYFPLYEIAPYAAGIPQFRIPYTLLENNLKEKYRKALVGR